MLRVYAPNTRDFLSFGIGTLTDVTKGKVTEHRNETYEISFEYPSGGKNAELIVPGNIVTATANDTDGLQPFRITDVQCTSPGTISVYGIHYGLWLISGQIQPPLTASGTAKYLLASIAANKIGGLGVTLDTDIAAANTYAYKSTIPKTTLTAIVGSEGSFVDTVGGGTLHFNGLTLEILRNRGADRGVSARYGSNLVSIDVESNLSGYASHIYPFYSSDGNTVLISGQFINLNAPADQPQKIELVDLTSSFNSAPTPAQLYTKAQKYATDNLVQIPQQTISTEFIPLWDTAEYKGKVARQRISIDDTITVIHPGFNLVGKSKVVGLEWDFLAGRYIKVKTGTIRRNILDTIAKLQKGAKV